MYLGLPHGQEKQKKKIKVSRVAKKPWKTWNLRDFEKKPEKTRNFEQKSKKKPGKSWNFKLFLHAYN